MSMFSKYEIQNHSWHSPDFSLSTLNSPSEDIIFSSTMHRWSSGKIWEYFSKPISSVTCPQVCKWLSIHWMKLMMRIMNGVPFWQGYFWFCTLSRLFDPNIGTNMRCLHRMLIECYLDNKNNEKAAEQANTAEALIKTRVPNMYNEFFTFAVSFDSHARPNTVAYVDHVRNFRWLMVCSMMSKLNE